MVLFGKENCLEYLSHCGLSPMTVDSWEKYRRNAVRYLQACGATPGALSILDLPFSCNAIIFISDFGDSADTEEQVLILRIPVEVFVEIEHEVGNWNHRMAQGIPEAVHALNRVGCNIKYVVAEIELDAENKPIEILNVEELKLTSATGRTCLESGQNSHSLPRCSCCVRPGTHGFSRVSQGCVRQRKNTNPKRQAGNN
jgi:hypothetical protein